MSANDPFDELNARWAALESQYEAVRQAVEARVTRWMWSDGEHFNLRPLFFERNASTSKRRAAG